MSALALLFGELLAIQESKRLFMCGAYKYLSAIPDIFPVSALVIVLSERHLIASLETE
jgi:hypothetical protein